MDKIMKNKKKIGCIVLSILSIIALIIVVISMGKYLYLSSKKLTSDPGEVVVKASDGDVYGTIEECAAEEYYITTDRVFTYQREMVNVVPDLEIPSERYFDGEYNESTGSYLYEGYEFKVLDEEVEVYIQGDFVGNVAMFFEGCSKFGRSSICLPIVLCLRMVTGFIIFKAKRWGVAFIFHRWNITKKRLKHIILIALKVGSLQKNFVIFSFV